MSCGPPRDEAPAIPPQSKPSTAAMPIPDIANATCAPLQSPTPSASPAAQARGCTAAVTHIMVSGWPRRRRPPSRICAARRLTVFVAHIAMQRHCRGPPAPTHPSESLQVTHPATRRELRPPAEITRSNHATPPRRPPSTSKRESNALASTAARRSITRMVGHSAGWRAARERRQPLAGWRGGERGCVGVAERLRAGIQQLQ